MNTDKKESSDTHTGKKSGNAKRKGSVLELERLKKREKELHVMKLSQEWDARRQKRRMDRMKWLQQRRDQNLPIWQRVGNLRVQATDETRRAERNSATSSKATKAVLTESNQGRPHSPSLAGRDIVQRSITDSSTVNEQREPDELTLRSSSPAIGLEIVQDVEEKSALCVKRERAESQEFCKSNFNTTSGSSSAEPEDKEGFESKAWQKHEEDLSCRRSESSSSAYQQLVTMVNSHPSKTYANKTTYEPDERTRQHYDTKERFQTHSEPDEISREIEERRQQMNERTLYSYKYSARFRQQPEAEEETQPMDERARQFSLMDARGRQHTEMSEQTARVVDVDTRTKGYGARPHVDRTEQTTRVPDVITSHTSVIVQAMRQSGIPSGGLDSEPTLLLASEPIRFEEVIREGGTIIQRLETSTAGIISKSRTPETQEREVLSPHSPAFSAESSRPESMGTSPQPDNQTRHSATRDDASTESPAQHSTITMATVNKTMQPMMYSSSTASPHPTPSGFLVPVLKPGSGEVVYAFVPGTSSPGSVDPRAQIHPSVPGNLLYHSLPRFGSPGGAGPGGFACPGGPAYPRVIHPSATIHHGRHVPVPRAELAKRTAEATRYVYHETRYPVPDPQDTMSPEQPNYYSRDTRDVTSRDQATGYPSPVPQDTRSPGQVVGYHSRESRKSESPNLKYTERATRSTESPACNTHYYTEEKAREMRSPEHETSVSHRDTGSPPRDTRCGSRTVSPAETPRYTNFTECQGSTTYEPHATMTIDTPHVHTEGSSTTAHARSREPQSVNGFSPTGPVNGQPTNSTSSSPFSVTSADTIINPTAAYVRPGMVPREIIPPLRDGSGGPMVEYIKTDSICGRPLISWNARNVADFVAATDCADSAVIFLEQDIDGKALLLLSQDIFVNKLNLKLGTAIKLYNHISNLRSAMLMR